MLTNAIIGLLKAAAVCVGSTIIIGGITVIAGVSIILLVGVATYRIAASC